MNDATPAFPPIVCFAGVDWSAVWQPSHSFMTGFARRGARVVFVEQLDAGRTVAPRDWRRVLHRAGNLLQRHDRMIGDIRVVAPPALPFRWARPINRYLLKGLAGRLRSLGFHRPILWQDPFGGPNATALARFLEPSLVVYHCVTRVRGYQHVTPEVIAAEDALTRRADIVITDARILWEEKRLVNPRCVRFPPAVEFDLFAPRPDWQEPPATRALARPRLGFFGGINERIDQETVVGFARSHPNWALVFIGPVMTDVTVLRGASNVFFFPQVPHAELGQWLQALDVLMIPYHSTDFTRGIIPAKLFECLASGKPVVAMGLPELHPYAHLIELCEPAGFAGAVEAALASDSPTPRAERIDLARRNSWAAQIDRAWQLLSDASEAKRQGRDIMIPPSLGA